MKEKIGEDKGFCLLRIKRVARIYGDFIFGKIRFWGCPKIKASKDCVFGVLPKIANLAFCQKLKLIFGIFLLLYSLERKVAFYEKKELQRSKMYKEVCE